MHWSTCGKLFLQNWRAVEQGIADLLSLYRWRWVHSRPALTQRGWRTPLAGAAGFPDFFALRPPRLIFIEVKTGAGRLSADQNTWRQLLAQVPAAEYYLWGAAELAGGKVQEVLR